MEANLREADLSEANLREVDLSEADLRGANLTGAKLRHATATVEQWETAASLKGAEMPDGRLHD
jgi:uncharacterized protein YjbI with pentapeptide repeats